MFWKKRAGSETTAQSAAQDATSAVQMPPAHIFRAYDLRGLVGSELNPPNVELLARAYATWLLRRGIKTCVVGRDCRTSGPEFSVAVIKGLTESGIDVHDIGMALSQMSYFAQFYFRTKGLVMITASHNPKEFNGFKFGMHYAETMLSAEIQEVREIAESGKFLSLPRIGKVDREDIFKVYAADVLRHTEPVANVKIVIDGCAATPGAFLPKILRMAGCEVIEQHTTPDGSFPLGTPDPTERVVQERLAKRVVAEGAMLGFSYDCDGDRMGIVDDAGNLIWNDTLIALFALDILERLPGTPIVHNVLSSKQTEEAITAAGGKSVMWRVGHSFIAQKVHELNAPFGGELSGHFFFFDNFYGYEDSAVASLRVLAYLSRKKQTLREAVAQLPHYISSPEIKLGCPDNVKFDLISKRLARELKKQFPKGKALDIDGIRIDTKEEMVVVRASQNGPYITVKFEAKTQARYDALAAQVSKLLHKYKEIDFASGVNTDAFDKKKA